MAEKNAKELQAGQKQSLKMAGASVMAIRSKVGDRKPASGPKCYCCNGTQHLARDCRFKAARIQCWALTLSAYDSTIEYKPGA